MGRSKKGWLGATTLLRAGAHIDTFDRNGQTPLSEACINNSGRCAEKLMAYGADVHAQDNLGLGLLYAAAMGAAIPDLLSLLISAGANINDTGNRYYGPPLGWAAIYNNTAYCERIKHRGVDIEKEDRSGSTPVISAVAMNAHECARLLLL